MALTNQQLSDTSTPKFLGVIDADKWYHYDLTFHAPSMNAAKAHWKTIVNQQMGLIADAKKIKIKFKEIK
jgi:hypothetical protein